jgi:hypothetical protein
VYGLLSLCRPGIVVDGDSYWWGVLILGGTLVNEIVDCRYRHTVQLLFRGVLNSAIFALEGWRVGDDFSLKFLF